MGARPAAAAAGGARLLGDPRLPRVRRPMARAAVRRRLNAPLPWAAARLVDARLETPTARTLVLHVPDWPGHLPGQHVDVRLTAEDSYSARRSYSIASAPDCDRIELTVQLLPDGEVSSFLVHDFAVGDPVELRGPLGGWFVWDPDDHRPVLLVGGGSGVVPLMAMLRTQRRTSSKASFRLVYSVRTPADVFYRNELVWPPPLLSLCELDSAHALDRNVDRNADGSRAPRQDRSARFHAQPGQTPVSRTSGKRLKSGRSAVRPRPCPQATKPQVRAHLWPAASLAHTS
ncbi:MAG: FAD-binding oxidoreductase [Nocardioidaceae bacterium]